jgi:phenylalanyl-tRNA synthetase beta chain
MLFSYNWLKEYLEGVCSPSELAERFTMTGTEIESVTKTGANFTGVVTAQVMTIDKHPNADKLSFCKVKTDKEEFSIVCGARNMKPGDKVALALIGAELPGDFKIKRSKIRGVESEGMMCSEVELGLKDTSEGILILPPDTPLGVDYSALVGSDCMFEAGVTPNRADLLSIKGMAREAAAITGAVFHDKDFPVDEGEANVAGFASVEIAPGAHCRRYAAKVVEGVTIGPSPEDIRQRLEAHGIRSINNVVDVTNLVLLETGQPMHAFDLARLKGKKIIVRQAAPGEKIETIDGKERALDEAMMVIADSERPVAIAGVMGGKDTEVTEATTTVLLESAWFDPSSVRRTSKKLGLSSDSSFRFERGVDMEGVEKALEMAAHLINKLGGGWVARGAIDIYPVKQHVHPIEFRVKRAQELIGAQVEEEDILEIFRKLRIIARKSGHGVLSVTPPSYRVDLKNETDLIEEVARIFGYNNIPTTLPVARLIPGNPGRLSAIRRQVKTLLAASGFMEVINYSFVSKETFSVTGPEGKKGVALINPLTEEQSVMRDSLLPSLLDNLKFNLARKTEEVRIFEFAPVFLAGGKLPSEKWKASGLLYGQRFEPGWSFPRDWVDFYDAKGAVEKLLERLGVERAEFAAVEHPLLHPGKAAALKVGGKAAGVLGELHPDFWDRYGLRKPAYLFELDVDSLMDVFGKTKKYRQLPRFPESARDIAFVIDEGTPFGELLRTVQKIDTKLIDKVELFDVYYGGNIPQGRRSLAIRVTYRSMERTLTAQEVEDIHSRVVRELTEKFKAEIRS